LTIYRQVRIKRDLGGRPSRQRPAISANPTRLHDHLMAGAAIAHLTSAAARNEKTTAPFGKRGGLGRAINR
jgi:hypothetical protein